MSKLSPDQWQALSPAPRRSAGDDGRRALDLAILAADAKIPTLASQLEMLLHEHRVLSEEGFLEEQLRWNCREDQAWLVKFLAPTLWFRRSAMGEWAASGWRNETTGDLSGA